MIATYVILPAIVVILAVIVLYYCCSRKYRINWFERTLLEAHEERDSEKEYINPGASSSRSGGAGAGLAPDQESLFHRSSIGNETHKSERSWSTTTTSSIPSISHPGGASKYPYNPLMEPPVAHHVPTVLSPFPSTPSSDKSSEHAFWVPPAVLEKKRAQSLVPTLQQPQEGEDQGESSTHTQTTHTRAHTTTHTYVHTRRHTHVHVRTHTKKQRTHTHNDTHIRAHTKTDTHTHTHAHAHTLT